MNKQITTTTSTIALAISSALSFSTLANELSLAPNQPSKLNTQLNVQQKAIQTNTERRIYIVELESAPVATYEGGVKGLAPTSNKITGAKKLNTQSKPSQAYRKFLKEQQRQLLASTKLNNRVKYDYQWVFNGMALEMSAAEAKRMASMPGVKSIALERHETLNTDSGPQWINAEVIWGNSPSNVPHSQGEGIVVAVLDTGINADHPSFAPITSDGYQHINPLGSGNYVPGSYCDVADASFCNDKLIGAWSFVPFDANYPSPEDSDGHGSHTASTVAGNHLSAEIYAPTTSMTRAISGVAPRANIIAYDVCIETCPGSALLAAVEQVVIDASNLPNGIHSLNYSISGGSNPYNDSVALGFLNATAAGIYVATSAGNGGPGASTNGHNAPWVGTTGASTHTRVLANSLIDMSSDTDSLADINSVGFTSGYGPAPIVYAGDYPTNNGSSNDTQPAQCLEPFPTGHFDGQIVICDRGTIARVAKGANVAAGGAGGLVLANLAAQGESVSADAHFIPGIHVGVSDGDTLKAWVASVTNPVASISGFSAQDDEQSADIMADFSSRGPNNRLDIIKPDITAPGVSILAAVNTNDPSAPAEFGFLSGTSMSSPHHAGAAAILSAARPDWSPYMIRSALMMTSDNSMVRKEDGVTPADAFDMGAGRIDLSRAVEADLVLDESPLNFFGANPDEGGDPKTLNIASMQDSQCLATCSWTRTFTNVTAHTVHMDLTTQSHGDASFSVSPSHLKVKAGETATVTVTADTRFASGWQFGQVNLNRDGDGPDLHLPIAVKAIDTTAAGVLSKTVSQPQAQIGDTLSYVIQINNGPYTDVINLSDHIPEELEVVPGSESAVIDGGSTLTPFTIEGNHASWSGTLNTSGLAVNASPAPFGYVSLASLGVNPFGCPGNCDDGGTILNVPSFTYNGEQYSSVIWSVNGTLEAGISSMLATSASNTNMPSSAVPNNLLAPLWMDLNMGVNGDGAEWRVAVLSAGPDQYTVYEWDNVPKFGDAANRYSFQIWVLNGPTQGIWFAYAQLGDLSTATVGAENYNGTLGSSYWYKGTGTTPMIGTDLRVESVAGGTATFSFDANVKNCTDGFANIVEVDHDTKQDKAMAATSCN
ncbi:S8 family serine peptidase [Pseudoalteromonas sp. BDTF-M6]|uniref:S8 family serine peptidase n=1 Tax=Pseudoalteromonas sp. BDTF-M6 TaxID=2796132 RepID=UPI001BAF5AAB|nr:S8 family serine peptidase [Pseudoalteromonas sp. BDTF-M6]MBS3796745.1 S8 family serine peptidase [Pseudoalteromonas sp. BDTF-M6]